MATSRAHFGLDWIKSDLLQTLNDARIALDEYAEQGGAESRIRECLTGLHQVHGILGMLELKGVTYLADHLEKAAQGLLEGTISAPDQCSRALMQGILELPGYLDELQRGAEDDKRAFLPLINEIRLMLDLEPMVDSAGQSLNTGAPDQVVETFERLLGSDKVGRMRSAYQHTLLTILKGEDRAEAVDTFKKIASGLQRLTQGSALERQWQAFGEFVESLAQQQGALESEAVRLLRRVDIELKSLATEGGYALRRGANVDLMQQLLDATEQRSYSSAVSDGLRRAVSRDTTNNTLAISGRQAMASAAVAMREELVLIKDKVDLLARTPSIDLEALRDLIGPLKQMSSTLSLLGFESSRAIMSDQIDAVSNLVAVGDPDPVGAQGIAAALVQIDENLHSVSREPSDVEHITEEAQLQLIREARKGLDVVKTAIVDYVGTYWDVRYLARVPDTFREVTGALGVISLTRVNQLLLEIAGYVEHQLMQEQRPDPQALDKFAEAVSGVDYFLERLAEANAAGAEDVLFVAERSMQDLQASVAAYGLVKTSQETPMSMLNAEAMEMDFLENDQVTGAVEGLKQRAPTDAAPLVGQRPSVDEGDVGPETLDTFPDFHHVDSLVFGGQAESDERTSFEIEPNNAGEASQNVLAVSDEDDEINLELESAPAGGLSSDAFSDVEEVVDTQQTPDQPATNVTDIQISGDVPLEVGVEVVELPDSEVVETFVKEAEEVLENIARELPRWVTDYSALEAVTEVRRAFHTLKGRARIVQAAAVGKLSWGVENMLNRVIDGTVKPNEQFVWVIDQACGVIPGLIESFKLGQPGDHETIANIVDAADLLASGASISYARDADKQETTAVVMPSESETASFETFIAESKEHLAVLSGEMVKDPWQLSELVGRAFDALAAIASNASCAEAGFIIAPANQVVVAWQGIEPNPDLKRYFAETFAQLKRCLLALAEGESWDDPVELVAQADDLIANAQRLGSSAAQFLASGAVSALFKADPAVEYLLARGTASPELLNSLTDFVNLARSSGQDALADLGAALLQTLPAMASGPEGEGSRARFLAGYELLVDQLNAMTTDRGRIDRSAVSRFIEGVQDVQPERLPEEEPEEKVLAALSDDAGWAGEERAGDEMVARPENAGVTLAGLDIDEDLARAFFEEAKEISEEVETSIIGWSEEMENRLFMENLLRALHTLKGGARLCGLAGLGDMVHDFESIVIAVQNHDRPVNGEFFVELHACHDQVAERLNAVKSILLGNAETTLIPEIPEEAVVDETPGLPKGHSASSTERPLQDIEDPALSGGVEASRNTELLEDKQMQVADAPAREEPLVASANTPQIVEGAGEETGHGDADKVEKFERTQQEMVRVDAHLLEGLVSLAGENSIVRARIEQGVSDFSSALEEMETTIERLREQLRRLEIETQTQILYDPEHADGPDYENVDALEMDRYPELQQLSRDLSESASDMLDLKDTLLFKARESETLLIQQARINTELQEGFMRTRMVPFSRLLPRLRRIVRQVSGELGKDVEFYVHNAEGELDRNVLERMGPPLEHMLRNAVDHGIESSDLRRKFGKPGSGRIDLRLFRDGGDVVIEVSDDGAGIDAERVREKAIERGLTTASAQLSDTDVLQFILAAGFSMAEAVTQISGRGVGMDVVHSEVKQLGGGIAISSTLGKGSRFVLRVPFTVSVNRVLMVSVTEDLYAIPLNNIEGILQLSTEQLAQLHTGEDNTFEYAGVPYRVRYLGQYLGRDYRGPQIGQSDVPVVLVRSGDQPVAMYVDAVQGSREIVVKSLGPQFAGVGGISGATILGDGNVVVILDLLALIRGQQDQSQRKTKVQEPGTGRARCVLVVDDSVTVRKMTSRLLERQGMDVLVAKDGVEAVAMLQEKRPDMMLLDIEMPRMDGFEVVRQVRLDDRLESLSIVMVSARTGDKLKEQARQLGVNHFLGKPFQENELLATIDELVTMT